MERYIVRMEKYSEDKSAHVTYDGAGIQIISTSEGCGQRKLESICKAFTSFF